MCTNAEFGKNVERETAEISHTFILKGSIERFKVQPDLESRTKVLDPNDIGVYKRMFYWALTKCIKPKSYSQSTFTRKEKEIIYNLFVLNKDVNFVWIVLKTCWGLTKF